MPLPLLDPSPVQTTFRTVLFALVLGGGGLVALLRLGHLARLLPRGLAACLRNRQAFGAMLASGLGIATVGVTVLAVESGGPGALVWMWLAGLAGSALQTAQLDIAAAWRSRDDGLLAGIAETLGRVGPLVAGTVALGIIAVTVLLGAGFQAQQAGQLVAAASSMRAVWVGPILALVLAFAVLRRRHTTAGWASPLALLATAGYLLGTLWILLGDTEAASAALSNVFADAWNPGATVAGTAGGSLLAVATIAVLRATEGCGAGLGLPQQCEGSDRKDREAIAAVMPLLHTWLIATLTTLVLLVHTNTGRPTAVASRVLEPLATIQRTATEPSIYGQTFTLPPDNGMQPKTRYPMWMFPHPRGQKLGQIADDNRTVGLLAWENTRDVDMLLFRQRGTAGHNPGFDVLVPCTRKESNRQGVPWLELIPKDPDLDLLVFMRAHQLEGPFVPLGPLLFTGTAIETLSHEGKPGMAMIEEPRSPADPLYPSLEAATKLRFAGPFVRESDNPVLAWALPSNPNVGLQTGTLEHLRLDPAPRGISLGVMAQTGYLVTPAWDFLAETTAAVIRHKEDPALDLMIPVRSQFHRGNLRFSSAVEGFELSRLELLTAYEPRPYLMPPPYRFDVEVHPGTRLKGDEEGVFALVPTIEYTSRRTDPTKVYHPGPREVLHESDMQGPVLDREGVASLREAFATRIPGGDLLLCLTLLPLCLLSLPAWLSRGVAAASYVLKRRAGSARPLVGALMVAAVVSGAAISLHQLLPAMDLSVMVLAELNVLALIAFLPFLRSGKRS